MSFYVVGKRRNSVNRPPTPDAVEDQEKEPTLQEIINIKVFFLKLFFYLILCYLAVIIGITMDILIVFWWNFFFKWVSFVFIDR